MPDVDQLLSGLSKGDYKSLARAISFVENDTPEGKLILEKLLINREIPIVGITGPPGAGKSTLINQLVGNLIKEHKKIAVLAVDPSSPFNYGALLGDRIRLNDLFDNDNVFIRSIATRGSLGGLSEKILEITDILRAAQFDYIFIETVGVGQSEVEIAGLADTTVVVMVPEAGDEIQTMKAGIMEIANIFVVNKADRPGADQFIKNLKMLSATHTASGWVTPVIKTIATEGVGVEVLRNAILEHSNHNVSLKKQAYLLSEKAYKLIQKERMKEVNRNELHLEILNEIQNNTQFNIYRFIQKKI